jgi:hypothetical protein
MDRPSPGATPGSPVPHAAGQALPVRHRNKIYADLYRRQGCFSARGVDLILVGPPGLAHRQYASASLILTPTLPPDRKLPRRPNDWEAMATARDKADAWSPASRP